MKFIHEGHIERMVFVQRLRREESSCPDSAEGDMLYLGKASGVIMDAAGRP